MNWMLFFGILLIAAVIFGIYAFNKYFYKFFYPTKEELPDPCKPVYEALEKEREKSLYVVGVDPYKPENVEDGAFLVTRQPSGEITHTPAEEYVSKSQLVSAEPVKETTLNPKKRKPRRKKKPVVEAAKTEESVEIVAAEVKPKKKNYSKNTVKNDKL